ncbi:MAG: hypothetical protein AAF447_19160, partial [Myxococcota bacterium]
PGHGAPGAATGAAAVSAAGPGVMLTLSGELVEGAPALAAGTEGSASELVPGAEDGAEDGASGNAVDPAPSRRELDALRLAARPAGSSAPPTTRNWPALPPRWRRTRRSRPRTPLGRTPRGPRARR